MQRKTRNGSSHSACYSSRRCHGKQQQQQRQPRPYYMLASSLPLPLPLQLPPTHPPTHLPARQPCQASTTSDTTTTPACLATPGRFTAGCALQALAEAVAPRHHTAQRTFE